MESTSPSKHLWLELRPDYIDANFQPVYEYLLSFRKSESNREDTFYQTTLDLLRQRAQELVAEEAARPVSAEETVDKDRCLFYSKILCLYLLNEPDTTNPAFKEAYFTLLFQLARCAKDSASAEQLLRIALEVFSCESVKSTGIRWNIFDLYSTDILAYSIINGYSLIDDPDRFVFLENKGILRANLGKILLAPVNRDTLKASFPGMVPNLSFFQEALQVLDAKTNKIKQGESGDIDKIEAFTDEFVSRQASVKPAVKKLHQYAPGETVDVELITKDGNLRVRTIDPEYECIEGDLVIANLDKFLYYSALDLKLYLNVGDQFPLHLQNISDKGNSKFLIDEEFKDYIIGTYKPGKVVLARKMEDRTNKKGVTQTIWWTEMGFPAYTKFVREVEKDEFAFIELSDTGTGSYRHFVNAYFDSTAGDGDTFDVELSKKSAIQSFTYQDQPAAPEKSDDVELSADLARQLCRMLYFYQTTLRSAVMRYRLLCTCRILAELVEDRLTSEYIGFVASYLENVVAFADDDYDDMRPLEYGDAQELTADISRRIDIVRILMEYGKGEDSDVLDAVIEDDADELLVKLSKLVQSANRIRSVVSDNLLVHIKKEIISNLSIDSEKKTDLEEKKGTYYGTEDATKEFKPSFFEAPDDSEHSQDWNVFKEMCAFFNSELGGTLYLGVADSGYTQGLDRDLLNLGKIGNKAYADNIDGYKRYILDAAKKFFPIKAVLMNLNFVPVEDGKVLAIRVDPWEGGIVEMDGKAFIRMDSESVEMDARMKDEVVRKKLLSKKDESGNVRNLQKAIEERRKVILHGYSSSSRTEDRKDMEPFAFDDDYQTIWCYDPSAGKCKSYKVARIGSVEVLETLWAYTAKHQQGKTDIFRMTGDKGIKIHLQLDHYSKLLLCEEFPKATDILVADASGETWYLDTEVRSLAGVGRFYMGLGKQHITIVDSPELVEYVAAFAKENL